ncbi:MAG: ABC-type transport auxiliary lipoprotein family protein [Proteobacteria bacterium]|nr:ABC-type transport auxiliary lipoprotein family protein [Pseudomonadota bacterium]
MIKHLKQLLIVLSFALILSACSQKTDSVKHYYRLAEINLSPPKKISKTTLVISRPSASGILGNRPMVATGENGALRQMNRNFWLESPKILLQEELKSWAGNKWSQVLEQKPGHNNYQILTSKISAFEKQQDKAMVSISFVLKNAAGDTLLDKHYQQSKSLNENNFRAFVTAISASIEQILEQLNRDIQP